MSAITIGRMTKRLRQHFPRCFCWPPVPLQIGITELAIQALYPASSRNDMYGAAVAAAVEQWTSHPSYLEALCKRDADRYGLDGTRRGHVTDAEALHAAELLQRVT